MRHWIVQRLAPAGPRRRSSAFLKVLGSCPQQPHMAKPLSSRASRSRTRRPPPLTDPAVRCGIPLRKKGNRRHPGKTDRQAGQKEFKANRNPDPDPAQVQGDQEQGGLRHQGWQRHPERLYRQGRTGRRLASHDTGRYIPAVTPGTGFSIHL